MDWSTFFPYILIATITLFSIGLYALFSAKKFMKIVFGIQMMFMAATLLLLSFRLPSEGGKLFGDPFAQTLSIIIIFIGGIFGTVGIIIDITFREKTKNNPAAQKRSLEREKGGSSMKQRANRKKQYSNQKSEASEL